MEQFTKEIEEEYRKIDKKWLDLQFKTLIAIVILAFFVECMIGMLMYVTNEISSTIFVFILKFLIIPSTFNFICILINYKVITSKKLSLGVKIYITSLVYVIVCFALFTVHSAFTALYFIFAVPILLTTIYGNYRLTLITSLLSLIGMVISELFIKWDVDKESIMGDGIRLGNFYISLFVLLAFAGICIIVIRFEQAKNKASMQKELERYKLQKRLQIDELTGIYNRIGFKNAIGDMEEDQSDIPYIFVMIDIDNFKLLNDSLGHVTGDQCLIKFGKILKNNCKEAIPFRYGGDEFGIIFKNRTMDDVIRICEQIQNDFSSIKLNKNNLLLTISIGIAKYSRNLTPSTLIIHTDKALYESKKMKNTITIYPEN